MRIKFHYNTNKEIIKVADNIGYTKLSKLNVGSLSGE